MKKLMSIVLVLLMLTALCTFTSAAAVYDVNAAIEYAAKHVNDNDGSQCAEFVSKCVQAGGLNIPTKTGTKGCWDAILAASGLSGENLTLNEKGYVTKNANENLLSRGDVVIQWCYTCDLRPHILICGGYDSEGYATFYAHNTPLNNKRYNFSKNSQHKSTCSIGAKVVQLSKLNSSDVSSNNASTPATNINSTPNNNTSPKKQCGSNVYWQLDNGIITISGAGDMWDFKNGVIYDNSPDTSSIELTRAVHTIIVNEGITSLGKFAFVRMTNVKNVSLPNTLKTIKAGAFFYVKPENITYNGSKDDWEKIVDEGVGTTMPLGDEFISKISFNGTDVYDSGIRIMLNNRFIECDQPPVIVNDRTLVPMRAIFEALGAKVEWDNSIHTAIGTKGEKTVSLTIAEKAININGVKKELDVAPQIINDRTMIPVRAVAEAFDCDVEWDAIQKHVVITQGNETPYRVEILDEANTVIGIAHFNGFDKLIEMSGQGIEYFTPFWLNIGGNTYVDTLGSSAYNAYDTTNIKLYYGDSDIMWKIEETTGNGNILKTEYTFLNGKLLNAFGFYKGTYKHESNKCIIGAPYNIGEQTIDADSCIFNENGLVIEYKFFDGGSFKRTYSYNNVNKLEKETFNSGGNSEVSYEYDKNGKLVYGKYLNLFTGEKTTFSYRYIEE